MVRMVKETAIRKEISREKNGRNKIANTLGHLGKITDRNTLDPTEQMIKPYEQQQKKHVSQKTKAIISATLIQLLN